MRLWIALKHSARIRFDAGEVVCVGAVGLEGQLGSELECPRIEGRGDLARLSTVETGMEATVLSGASKLSMVPDVEGIYAEFKCRSARLADHELLEQRQIPVVSTWAAQGIEGQIAPSPCGWRCEGRDVGPLNPCYLSGGTQHLRFGIRDCPSQVGPVANSSSEQGGDVVAAHCHVERGTTLHRDNSGQRPATE
jgi:hypothetical protein